MKINGIDKGLSSTDLNFGDRYLTLDVVPSRGWVNHFEAIYQRYHSPAKREVRFANGCLIVKCPADELQAQIITLNGILKSVDEAIAEKIAAERQREADAERIEQENKKKADQVYDKLKFD